MQAHHELIETQLEENASHEFMTTKIEQNDTEHIKSGQFTADNEVQPGLSPGKMFL